MSYSVPAFRPQIYSYQSRGRTRQYPRQVVTPIPGAGYAVKNLRWGEQAIDLSGLGVVPDRSAWSRWWELTPAFWAQASSVGFDDYPQRHQAEAAGGPVFLQAVRNSNGDVVSVVAKWSSGGIPTESSVGVSSDKIAGATRAVNTVAALKLPTLSTAEVEARLDALRTRAPSTGGVQRKTNRTALYAGIGLGAAALLGGGYYLWKRGKKAA